MLSVAGADHVSSSTILNAYIKLLFCTFYISFEENVQIRFYPLQIHNIFIFSHFLADYHNGPARQPDTGILRHPGGQPVRRAGRPQVDQGEYSGMAKLYHC